jgi:endoglucanase
MKNVKTQFARLALICAVLCVMGLSTSAQTPVATNGALHITGNKVMNKNNQVVSFSGPSYFWSNTGWGAERFYNAGVVNYFRNNWNASIVRAAMGAVPVDGGGSYLADASNKTRVKTVVDAAISAGMYVIIDWHTHHAESYQNDAVNFFREMAQTYGTKDNVIYEIYNEPLNVSWSGTIKPYAQAVISAIRSVDPDNLIIVGTPNWSQDVDAASLDPISGTNIAYTLHFYAATHKADLRAKASTALSRGLALFVTEWGTCDASGAGSVDQASTNEWVAFLKANNISNCNWAINDKAEAASRLNGGVNSTGSWSDSDLTTSGKIVKDIVKNWGGSTQPPTCTVVNLPATIQAENYCDMSGVQLENTSDSGGGQNVGWIDAGDWLSYSINVPSTGSYLVQYRVASASGGGSIRLEKQGGTPLYGTITVPSTSGWQNWQTISQTVQLTAGTQNIALAAQAGGFNINWLSIAPSNSNTGFSLTVQAESFSEMAGIQTETTSDTGGGLNVGYIDTNDWMKYSNITVPSTGSYLFEFRVASPNSNGVLSHDLNSGAIQLGTIGVPNTGGWQNWQTISRTVTLNAGTYSFGIFAATGGWNINWWRISKPGGRLATNDNTETREDIRLYPNPAETTLHVRGLTEDVKRVSVLDVTGRELIVTEPNKQSEISINLEGLTRGIHFIKVEGNHMKVMRFSKQ